MRPLSWAAWLSGAATGWIFVAVCGLRLPSMIACAAFVVGMALRARFSLSNRTVGAVALACLGLAALGGESLFEGTAYISSLTFRLALGLTVLLGLSPIIPYDAVRERIHCCICIIGAMVALVSFSAGLETLLPPVLLQFVATAYWLRQLIPGSRPSPWAMAALLPALLGAALLAELLNWSETKVNVLYSLMSPQPGMTFPFPSRSRLSTLSQAETNPAVVLRYYSSRPATYLVARCYATYQEGTWNAPADAGVNVTGEPIADSPGWFRFELTPAAPEASEEEVELAGPGPERISPRDTQALVTTSPTLRRIPGDTLVLQGQELRRYRLLRRPGQFPQEFGSGSREPWLQVPESLRPRLRQLGDQWTAQLPAGPRVEQTLRRCKAIETYFQDNFKYGFGYPFGKSKEPVDSFLTDRPPAHCEMFASALALMLRCYNIPTRYINGFVVKEHNTPGGYSIVRVRHAHAWVEAYIDDYGWILLDGTPGEVTQSDEAAWTRLQGLSDCLFHLWDRVTHMSPGELLRELLALVKRQAVTIVLLLIAAWLWQQRHSFRLPRLPRGNSKQKAVRRAAQGVMLDRVEEALRRQLGWIRPPNMTLSAWARDKENPAKDFYDNYVAMLYGREQPGADNLEKLADKVLEWAAQVSSARRTR